MVQRLRTVAPVLLAVLACTTIAAQGETRDSIVGWGKQVIAEDLSSGFTAVAAGYDYTLGLKTDGSIVA